MKTEFIKWFKAAGIRAVKTMAQTAVALIPVGTSITEVSWMAVIGTSILAGALSLLTSLAGLPMGTRCGDIDPSIVTFLMKKENLTTEQMDKILNKQSGKLGISGVSFDDRDIEVAAEEGNARAKLAIDVFVYQVVGYIGRFAAQMNGVDAITFAGGVGENGIDVRKQICESLSFLGVKIDEEKNNCRGKEVEISTPDSNVKVFVIPTDEELTIARDTMEIVNK